MGLLQLLLVLSSAVILRSESHGTHDQILLSQIWDSPNLVGQVPVFISPQNRVAQLYPRALGSLFIASYDLQDYDGGIWPHLHTRSYYIALLRTDEKALPPAIPCLLCAYVTVVD
jgi:hypothetical protein